jgi:hypothetical protein
MMIVGHGGNGRSASVPARSIPAFGIVAGRSQPQFF